MIIAVGTNHRRSPVEIRERFAFTKGSLRRTLLLLLEPKDVRAAVILSTCNRVEVYADARDAKKGVFRLKELLSQRCQENSGMSLTDINTYLYGFTGRDAIQHLFEVAAGLDSQVLGETEILEQVRFAYQEAKNIGAVNGLVAEIFTAALATAKKVRNETGLAQGKVSIGSVAVDFIREKIGALSDKRILIIGVGKISELVAMYLKKEGPDVVFVANRTFRKAEELSEKIGGKAIRFDELKREIKRADVVISATASPHLIIRKEDLAGLEGSLLILDLAVPTDVDIRVREIPGVELFRLNSLDSVIHRNLEKRKNEAEIARRIITGEVAKTWKGLLKPKQGRLEPERSIWWEPVRATPV